MPLHPKGESNEIGYDLLGAVVSFFQLDPAVRYRLVAGVTSGHCEKWFDTQQKDLINRRMLL